MTAKNRILTAENSLNKGVVDLEDLNKGVVDLEENNLNPKKSQRQETSSNNVVDYDNETKPIGIFGRKIKSFISLNFNSLFPDFDSWKSKLQKSRNKDPEKNPEENSQEIKQVNNLSEPSIENLPEPSIEEQKDMEDDLPVEQKPKLQEIDNKEVEKIPNSTNMIANYVSAFLTREKIFDSCLQKIDLSLEEKVKTTQQMITDPDASLDMDVVELFALNPTYIEEDNIKPVISELKKSPEVQRVIIDSLLDTKPQTEEEKLKKLEMLCGSPLLIGEEGLVSGKYKPIQFEGLDADTRTSISERINLDTKEIVKSLVEEHSASTTLPRIAPSQFDQAVEEVKQELKSPEIPPEKIKSFVFPTTMDDRSASAIVSRELRKDEEIINRLAESELTEEQNGEKIQQKEEELRKVTASGETSMLYEKQEELKSLREKQQVEAISVFCGSFENEGLLQEEKLNPDLRKQAAEHVAQIIQKSDSFSVLINAETSGIMYHKPKLLEEETEKEIQEGVDKVKEAIDKKQLHMAEEMTQITYPIEEYCDFQKMAHIAKSKSEEVRKIVSSNEFTSNFARVMTGEYTALDAASQTKTTRNIYQEKGTFFNIVASVFRQNPSLAEDEEVRASMVNIINFEYEKSCADTNKDKVEYKHVIYSEKIAGLFNQLFKAEGADRDYSLTCSARQFFKKELMDKEPMEISMGTPTLVRLCANKNFVKDEELKNLVTNALCEQELDSDDIIMCLKNKKEREQFVETIGSLNQAKKDIIISKMNRTLNNIEDEDKKKKMIEEIIVPLSQETSSTFKEHSREELPKEVPSKPELPQKKVETVEEFLPEPEVTVKKQENIKKDSLIKEDLLVKEELLKELSDIHSSNIPTQPIMRKNSTKSISRVS